MANSTVEDYKMDHKKRGICLIINNEIFDHLPQRVGTKVDEEKLTERFRTLYFDVRKFKNLGRKKMKDTLKEVSLEDHSDSDCFVCVILSHGEKDMVHGTDGPVEVNTLLERFNGNNCKTLVGKPKIFFIQACRGIKCDEGATLGVKGDGSGDDEDMEDMEPVPQRIPTEADFLVTYSSVSGFYSFRNPTNGSWFIQALCKVMEGHGTALDLMTMMTMVNRKVAYEFESETNDKRTDKKKQIPCITSMLTKNVYFRDRKT